jgi:murein DD-endopeptidase MepM/ murein hydrolase activator NlpD
MDLRTIKRLFTTATLGLLAVASTAAAVDFSWPQSGRVTGNWYSSRPAGQHRAVDIAGPNRSAVGAARGGRVVWRGKDIYGALVVIVAHASGYRTVYAHFSRFGNSGTVTRGETIGYEGSTGFSTGPHVHFHMTRWGSRKFMPARIGATLRKGATIPYNYPGVE